ncbi:TPA: hypothetical protein ACGOYV_001729 [Streptococcus suis]
MTNKFSNFQKAREEVSVKKGMLVSEGQELKKTYSFTLLPSERQMLKELAESSPIRVSDSQFLSSLIRDYYLNRK